MDSGAAPGTPPDRAVPGDGRVVAAAQQRRRRRWLAQQLDEEAGITATLCGALGRRVELHLVSGATERGTVARVGADVVVLTTPSGHDERWVRLAAVAAVTAAAAASSETGQDADCTLESLVEDAASHELGLVVLLCSGARLQGIAVAVAETLVLRVHSGDVTVIDWQQVESLRPR